MLARYLQLSCVFLYVCPSKVRLNLRPRKQRHTAEATLVADAKDLGENPNGSSQQGRHDSARMERTPGRDVFRVMWPLQFLEISDNISETVQDRYIVAIED